MTDDIFLKRISDTVRLCEKYSSPRFSVFLNEQEQAIIKKSEYFLSNCMLFGGYPDSERRIFGVFPDWQEPTEEEFPITALKFTKKYDKELTHRNYLGTILSLGLERTKIGDILVYDKGAYVFAASDIADFAADNIGKISHCGVEVEKIELGSIEIPERKFEEIDAVSASARLDAVLAALLNISRSEAKNMILSGKVMVNHFEKNDTDYNLAEGALLSIRGFGRAEVLTFGNQTRSGRIHIRLKKYI